MNNLPIGFRDFIIYTVPGAIFLLQLAIILFLSAKCFDPGFSINDVEPYLSLFKEKGQIFFLFLFIIISYVFGMLLNQEMIKSFLGRWVSFFQWDSPLDKYLRKICSKNNSQSIYDEQRRKIVFDFIKKYNKNLPVKSEKLDRAIIWLMLRCIEGHGDVYLKDSLNRINNIRNFCRNIFFVFSYSAGISLILVFYAYLNHFSYLYLLLYLIFVIFFLFLSFNRYRKFSHWLVRSVIDSYYAVFLHTINDCKPEIIQQIDSKLNF